MNIRVLVDFALIVVIQERKQPNKTTIFIFLNKLFASNFKKEMTFTSFFVCLFCGQLI